ncbi:MAG: tetratricopeptide repeat protein [Pseudomonadota bacterium]|nr:tetratricopeptide repeat protein [Pseudomonadota bacterium]
MRVIVLLLLLCSCLHGRKADTRIIARGKNVQDKFFLPKFLFLEKRSSPLWLEVQADLQKADYFKVENDMRAYLANSPGDQRALATLMKALFLQKKYDLARYYARYLLAMDSKNHDAHMLIGLIELSLPETDYYQRIKALNNLMTVFEEDEQNIAAGLNLATLLMARGSYKQAMEYFARVYGRCPACGIAKIGVAICLVRLDRMEDANFLLNEVSRKSKDVLARYYLALTYIKAKINPAKGIDILTSIMENERLDGTIRNKSRTLILHAKDDIAASAKSAPTRL